MSDKFLEVTDESFEQDVVGADLPVLIDFWADWCQPCKMLDPHVEALSKEYEGKLTVAKANADENLGLMGKFNITGIPTLILFKDGEAVERLTGYMPKNRLKDKLDPFLS